MQKKKLQSEQDHYRRIKLLGEGAYGKAFLAQCIHNKALYVMKQINMADLSSKERQDTKKEALILSKMAHPYIIKFRQVYTTKGDKLILVMDYAQGGDLAKKIIEQKAKVKFFQEEQILDWFTQISLAIKHVHDRKIIHRDIKGQNIFLTANSKCKLGDFGIARALNSTFEKARTVVGTPYYLSPQIIQNKPYSFHSDIWSLGVLLYQMCMLKPPFTGQSLQFLALKIVKGTYQPLSPNFSQPLKNMLNQMLQTDPTRRPSINQIVHMPIIEQRLKVLLTQSQRNYQFSHTILHNRNIMQSKLSGLSSMMGISGMTSYQSEELEAPPKIDYARGEKPVEKKMDPIPVPIQKKQLKRQPIVNKLNSQKKPQPLPINKVNIRPDLSKEKKQHKAFPVRQKEVRQAPLPKGIDCAFMNPAFQKKMNQKKKRVQSSRQLINRQEKSKKQQAERQKLKDRDAARMKERQKQKERERVRQRSKEKSAIVRAEDRSDIDQKRQKAKQLRQQQRSHMLQDIQRIRKLKEYQRWNCNGSQDKGKSVTQIQAQNKAVQSFLAQLQADQQFPPQVPSQQTGESTENSPRFADQEVEDKFFSYSQTNQALAPKPGIKDLQFQKLVRDDEQMQQVIKQLQVIVDETSSKVNRAVQRKQDFMYNDELFDTMVNVPLQQRQEDQFQPPQSLQDKIQRNIIQINKADEQTLEYISDFSKLESLRIRLQDLLGLQLFIVSYNKLQMLITQLGLQSFQQRLGREKYRAEIPELKEVSEETFGLLLTLIVMENVLAQKKNR